MRACRKNENLDRINERFVLKSDLPPFNGKRNDVTSVNRVSFNIQRAKILIFNFSSLLEI